jgi:hypothetical protein
MRQIHFTGAKMSTLSDTIKDKIVAVIGVMVVIIAIAALLPTLQSGLVTINLPLLNYALIGTLISVGILLFVIEAFL